MAGIDKTYITSYEDYKKVIDWCRDKSFKLSNGQVIYPSNFIYYPDITKEEWDENEKMFKQEYPDEQYDEILWNTPIYFDIWLIRNCPFDFIQNRLKEQYGGGWSKTAFTDHNESLYEQIKNGTSPYDTYKRPDTGKIKIELISGRPFRASSMHWFIGTPYRVKDKETNGIILWYNEDVDQWYSYYEALPFTSSDKIVKGPLTKKNIYNMVRKWKLPKGTQMTFDGTYSYRGKRYLVTEYLVTVI